MVEQQLEQDLENMFYDPPSGPLDSKIFSPLHSQMQAELGSSGMYYPFTNDFNSGPNGVQFQYGTNEPDDISEFLDSVLNNSEDAEMNVSLGSETMKNEISVKEEAEPEAKVAQVLVSPVLSYFLLLWSCKFFPTNCVEFCCNV